MRAGLELVTYQALATVLDTAQVEQVAAFRVADLPDDHLWWRTWDSTHEA